MKITCNNCDAVIDKTRSSYYVKQDIKHGSINEVEFCGLPCLNKFEKKAIKSVH